MLETFVLAISTGTWTMLGLIAGFAILGLIALGLNESESDDETGEAVRYIFGLGKIPRLRKLPENRDIPATPEDLGPSGLRSIGKTADSTAGLDTSRYRLASGIRRPWDLSGDIPDTVEAIEIEREGGGRIWITVEGHVTAQPALDEAETEALEDILGDELDRHELRADRRTWSHSTESAEAVNAKRV